MRYKLIQDGESGILLVRDDGYRIHVKYLDGPCQNIDRGGWYLVMDYKQCEFPGMAGPIVDHLMHASVTVSERSPRE